MTIGEFCKFLNPDDFIVIQKTDGGIASGYVHEMDWYNGEQIIHISADRYPVASRENNYIGYEIEVE